MRKANLADRDRQLAVAARVVTVLSHGRKSLGVSITELGFGCFGQFRRRTSRRVRNPASETTVISMKTRCEAC